MTINKTKSKWSLLISLRDEQHNKSVVILHVQPNTILHFYDQFYDLMNEQQRAQVRNYIRKLISG